MDATAPETAHPGRAHTGPSTGGCDDQRARPGCGAAHEAASFAETGNPGALAPRRACLPRSNRLENLLAIRDDEAARPARCAQEYARSARCSRGCLSVAMVARASWDCHFPAPSDCRPVPLLRQSRQLELVLCRVRREQKFERLIRQRRRVAEVADHHICSRGRIVLHIARPRAECRCHALVDERR